MEFASFIKCFVINPWKPVSLLWVGHCPLEHRRSGLSSQLCHECPMQSLSSHWISLCNRDNTNFLSLRSGLRFNVDILEVCSAVISVGMSWVSGQGVSLGSGRPSFKFLLHQRLSRQVTEPLSGPQFPIFFLKKWDPNTSLPHKCAGRINTLTLGGAQIPRWLGAVPIP